MTLNLRDHHGQRSPDEALRRHAEMVGFEKPAALVRAWRAGEAFVLLDGFDEIATTGWQGRDLDVRSIRRTSVELIRRFADETPPSVGILVTGRRHFFDSEQEMLGALGFRTRTTEILATDEFTDEQVDRFLATLGVAEQIPSWLPTHPLLLGHLVSPGIPGQLGMLQELGPGAGWDRILDLICEREARMELGLDGRTIRRILERLASIARLKRDGVGPIFQQDLVKAFEQICGTPPVQESFVVLQRMPGLGISDAGEGSRVFIDEDLLEAARAGDLVRYATHEDQGVLEGLQGHCHSSSTLGIDVCVEKMVEAGATPNQIDAAAKRLMDRGGAHAIALDLVRVASRLGSTAPPAMTFGNVEIDVLSFADGDDDFSALAFDSCSFEHLDLTEYDGAAPLPLFTNCLIGTVIGAGSWSALPAERFVDCEIGEFDPSSKTMRGIMAMPGLTPRQKVGLTVLKKLYMQKGTGRKVSALYRGLDATMRSDVDRSVDVLIGNGLATKVRQRGTELVLPNRGSSRRVRELLEAGPSSRDVLLKDLA